MNKILEIQPDKNIKDYYLHRKKILFLAGTIENNNAPLWQKQVIEILNNELVNESLLILNPRRDVWTASLEQTVENLELKKQIEWELYGLELADIIYMHFEKDSKSPISLLELGLFAKSKKILLNCPDGFYRKANVDIICEQYNIENIKDYDASIKVLIQKIINK
jgi:hypothetical protein